MTCTRLITHITWILIVFASILNDSTAFHAQCNQDVTPPTVLTCPSDFEVSITQGRCTPSLYWPIPTATDACQTIINGFTNSVAFGNWSSTSNGTGALFTSFAPDSIRIKGTNTGIGSTYADFCIRPVCNGSFSFHWAARKTGFSTSFAGDHAYYLINGTPYQLTPNNNVINASGDVKVNFVLGDVFCFRVLSNNLGAQTLLTISNLVYDDLLIQQISGPTPETSPGADNGTPVPAGIYPVSYSVKDCSGNESFCNFTVTVTDTPPTITCPPSVDILLDTMDCNRVYCYNVEGNDNCINTGLNLPGLQFIGEYNGNTYYISDPATANHVHWLTANLLAAQAGGHLVTIQDAAENSFLTNNIPFANPLLPGNGIGSNQYWLGMRYSPSQGQYKWTTGEPVNYTNWGLFQPGVVPGDFIWFLDLFNSGTWWDSPSLLFRRYIVEIEGGVQTKLVSGIPSGNPFPPGVTTNVYMVTDAIGQTSTCSFDVNVIGSTSISCKNINVSLDQDCQVRITPQMLLTGPYNCYDVFEVNLTHYGKPIPNPIDSHYLGQHIIATVRDQTTGNSCWSDVIIEDKLSPEIICRNDTMSCFELETSVNPATVEDCSRYTVTLLDELVQNISCDTYYIKRVIRKWVSTDAQGNVSDTCSQNILVRRPNIDAIVFPEQNIILYCQDSLRVDENGNPSPYITDIPYLDKVGIWPTVNFNCNLYVDYTDQDLGEIACTHKIMRTWRVREWWCNQELIRTFQQFIQIKDLEGPIITHAPYDFHATTSHKSCYADIELPPVDAYDACHKVLRTDVEYPGGILVNKNGGRVLLPVGVDTIVYRIYDNCYNVTIDTLLVTVKDETEPVAICERRTVVSLNDAGVNWVPAEVFDDGSFDECHLHHFEVRRMDDNRCGIVGADDWGPEVGFCCEDVGASWMVAFRAIDASGNASVCMVSVEVQDKDVPTISCPPDVYVDCRYDIDMDHLDASFGKVVTRQEDREKILIDPIYWSEIHGHPEDGLAHDNCDPVVREFIDSSSINQCGIGTIIRLFTVTDRQGNSASCTQHISITNHHRGGRIGIIWPENFDTSGICNPDLLIPERLAAPYNLPTFTDDECSLVGISYHDHVFSQTVPGDPCFKIFRVWKVIDWCYRNDAGDIQFYIDTQIIKISNLVDPVITKLCRDTTICTYDVECRPIPIRLSIDATDDCTEATDLLYRYKVDLNSDGIIDIVNASIGGNVATGTWPLGRHILKWEVEDRCGNTAICQSVVNLINCKAPTAYCHRDISVGLVPMDLDGDGTADTKMVQVWASDIDAGSSHNCGYKVNLSFSKDTADKSRIFTCNEVGPQNVELWVTDINGNTSVCKTVIIVWDNPENLPKCNTNLQDVTVSGLIKTEDGKKVEYVEVELAQAAIGKVNTNFEGEYAFGPIPTGGAHEVVANKNDDWLNGVSTADIVKIQRHILGIEVIKTPYRMIAADVNKSKSVTAKDISDLRKLILGVTNAIPGNTSWRFVDENFTFRNVSDALNENFPENYPINVLTSNMNVNFIGVKVGDVNQSAKTRGVSNTVIRSSQVLDLNFENQSVKENEIIEIPFSSNNISEFGGFQMTLEVRPEAMEIIDVEGNKSIRFGDDNYSMYHEGLGKITISWNGQAVNNERLFTLKLRARTNVKLSDVISINSSITPMLGFDKELEDSRIQLRSSTGVATEFVLLQNEPNPWSTTTSIGMLLPHKGEVMLTIYDATGKIYYKEEKTFNKGYNEWMIEKTQIESNGVYYYQVDFDTNTQTRKMVILK